jgi:chromosomal replication initiation ATPase DnaA
MPEQLALPLSYLPAMGAQDFFVAPCNQEAVAWFDSWPHWPSLGCVLTGPAKCGKTHLVSSFAAATGARIIRPGQMHARLRTAVLIVDGLGADSDQEALFHLFNYMHMQKALLILVCQQHPQYWSNGLADTISRVSTLPHITIKAPDETVLAAVMVKQFRDLGLSVEPNLIAYALTRLERSFLAVSAFTHAIEQAALAEKRAISVNLAGRVLKSLADYSKAFSNQMDSFDG